MEGEPFLKGLGDGGLELADDNFRRPGADVRFFSLVACWTKWVQG